MQHISDLHSKFALGPHHVWNYGIDIQSAAAEIRRGIKKKIEDRKIETTGQKYNVRICYALQGGHKKQELNPSRTSLHVKFHRLKN